MVQDSEDDVSSTECDEDASASTIMSPAASCATASTPPRSGTQSANSGSYSRAHSSLDGFVDSVTTKQQNSIWEALARAVYASNSPLSIFEDPYWIEAFKIIRPSLRLPTRYQISTPLLNQEFARVETSVKECVGQAKTLGLQCDGWTNLRNEPIITFILTTPAPVVIKTINTTTHRHTGEYMAQVMADVIEENGVDKFLGIVTDNAKNMKKAWEILQKKFEDYPIAFYGCIAHIFLNLLVNVVLKLKTCSDLQAQCKDIIKNIQGSHILNALFVQVQRDKNKSNISLKLPVKTRWGSIVTCLKSLVVTKYALQALAVSEEASNIIDKAVKTRILDNDVFWVKVEKTVELLNPLLKWITFLEGDNPRISVVPQMFAEIKGHFMKILPSSPFSASEEKKILQALEKRKKFAVRPVHFAANILDPEYMGRGLSPEDDVDGAAHIYKVAKAILPTDVVQIMSDFGSYRCAEGLWAKDFVRAHFSLSSSTPAPAAGTITAQTWWSGICRSSPLSQVAVGLLNLPASSAATERSFSTYGFVHTKKRNRLTTKRAGDLMLVSHNLKLSRNRGKKIAIPQPRAASGLQEEESDVSEESEAVVVSDTEETTSDSSSLGE